MNSKRKAEIQRRLTLSAVPKPPEGLADRIKSDIPNYLEATEVERQRFSRSIAFNMRVAASILLLITSLVVTMKFLSPADVAEMKFSATASNSAPQQRAQLKDASAAASASAVDELRVDISEEPRPAVQVASTTSTTILYEPPPTRQRNEVVSERDAEGAVVGGVVGGANVGASGRVLVAEAAPSPAFTSMMSPEVASNVTHPAAPASEEPQVVSRAAAPSFVREAIADDLALEPKSTVFGISVDPNAFERVKSTIERGARPAAATVNVDALVNYFAGSAPKRVRRDVQLEAEGSPAPVEATGRRGVVRFTVDTRTNDLAENASVPPIATDAHVEIDFNPSAVVSSRRIGAGPSTSEATLLSNTSVTGLYEVELKPGIGPGTRIATVTLRYKSIADGKERSRYVVVRGSDFARNWTSASRRHRLASLGAVWGESLIGTGDGSELAVKAEELATQAPNDARARALAAVAKVGGEQ